MKSNIINICFICLLLLCACTKMDEYKIYTEGKERAYAGKVDSIKVHPGHNKIKLSWLIKADPRTVKTVIYWNNRSDSTVVDVVREEGMQVFTHTISPLNEGNYSFEIINTDSFGRKSVPSFIVGKVYGQNYINTLLTRAIRQIEALDEKTVKLTFAEGDATSDGVLIEYESLTGLKSVNLNSQDVEIVLDNFSKGTELRYKTLFRPDTLAIDTFSTTWSTVKPEFVVELHKSLFKRHFIPGDTPLLTGANDLLENAWDGRWSTNYDDPYGPTGWTSFTAIGNGTEPTRVTIDLGRNVNLRRFRMNHYWQYERNMPSRYEIYGVSSIPTTNGLEGWTKLATFQRNVQSRQEWEKGDIIEFVPAAPDVRYIRIVCYSSMWGTTNMNFAEVTFWELF